MQPPLEIQDYFVEDIAVRANPGFDTKKGGAGTGLNFSFDIFRKGKAPAFMILMSIKAGNLSKETMNSPYAVRLTIRGFFSFFPGTPEEVIDKTIGLNGLSILYGVARGVVAQATANGPHGKFLLPTVNFIEVLKQKAKPQSKKVTTK